MTIRSTALLQRNVLLPHFKTSMAWLLLSLCVVTVILASAYVMLVNWAVSALIVLYLSLKIRHEPTRIIATIVVLVLSECAALLLYATSANSVSAGSFSAALFSAINACICSATWVPILFLTAAFCGGVAVVRVSQRIHCGDAVEKCYLSLSGFCAFIENDFRW